MRRDDNVVEGKKWIISAWRFFLQHIEGSPCEMSARQGCRQSGGFDEVAACGVDEEGTAFHRSDAGGVEYVFRLRC